MFMFSSILILFLFVDFGIVYDYFLNKQTILQNVV